MITKITFFCLVAILLVNTSCSYATSDRGEKMNKISNQSFGDSISVDRAKNIAKILLENEGIEDEYKLNSAYVYKRLTDNENIAIGFKAGFFNLKNPFVYVVIIDRVTGEVNFSAQMK